MAAAPAHHRDVVLAAGPHTLHGTLCLPADPRGVVLFAHGSGSSRHSPRNQYVAEVLQQAGFATLLMDLLDEGEANDRHKVFDTELLADRLLEAMSWLAENPATANVPVGLFGASTGAGAAFIAAARRPEAVRAIVSRGGRPDLAGDYLAAVQAPTLLIVGGLDEQVAQLNDWAARHLRAACQLAVIPGATHLFPEPGALEEVATLARDWFRRHLAEESTKPVEGFRDRAEAGRLLAERLRDRPLTQPLVLGIPRGGVVTGAALAKELGAELDVVLARKLRTPWHAELAMGALSEEGEVIWNPQVLSDAGVPPDYAEGEIARQTAEIERRKRMVRAVRPAAAMAGRSVILTDDGIATGATLMAALHVVRHHRPREIIVAVPVAPPAAVQALKNEGVEVVCLLAPIDFRAVGEFYEDFEPVEDAQVLELLRQSLGVGPT